MIRSDDKLKREKRVQNLLLETRTKSQNQIAALYTIERVLRKAKLTSLNAFFAHLTSARHRYQALAHVVTTLIARRLLTRWRGHNEKLLWNQLTKLYKNHRK